MFGAGSPSSGKTVKNKLSQLYLVGYKKGNSYNIIHIIIIHCSILYCIESVCITMVYFTANFTANAIKTSNHGNIKSIQYVM